MKPCVLRAVTAMIGLDGRAVQMVSCHKKSERQRGNMRTLPTISCVTSRELPWTTEPLRLRFLLRNASLYSFAARLNQNRERDILASLP